MQTTLLIITLFATLAIFGVAKLYKYFQRAETEQDLDECLEN